MKRNTVFILLAGYAVFSMGASAYGSSDTIALDVSTVTNIVVTGEASTVKLTTNSNAPQTANLRSIRKGWFAGWHSNWFSVNCEPAGAMRIDNKTLFIDVPSSSFSDFADCTVEISANVPSDIGVSINQAAFMANLSGDFSDVTMRGKAADISLDGHAGRIDIVGEAVRTRFDFNGAGKGEADVRISAKALDASLKFAEGTPIHYKIEATASFIDSKLADTLGAESSVLLKGEFVRATIR